jgi:predicted site-specific integrase-resolvase
MTSRTSLSKIPAAIFTLDQPGMGCADFVVGWRPKTMSAVSGRKILVDSSESLALTPTPAAQYLRMSTNQQRLSIESQAAAIEWYAYRHDFKVVQTYQDTGRSGLTLNRREGLKQLLQDVFSNERAYKAILVYDVSRWGRFQDPDEAAHYEFLCKRR